MIFVCETCKEVHDGKYGSGRFCDSVCKNTFVASLDRSKRNKKIAETSNGKKIPRKDTKCKYCIKIFPSPSAAGAHSFRCHSNPQNAIRAGEIEKAKIKKYNEMTYSEVPKSYKRERIFNDQNGKCNKCSLDKWLGELITLEIEHKDGNHQNNARENLELLCPNCHSLTTTWRGRNKNKGKSGKRVTDEEMMTAIKETTTICQALLKVGLAAKGGNYSRAKRLRILLNSQ
jgi:5-methylcytosine-specific restriction endonuclease McrA